MGHLTQDSLNKFLPASNLKPGTHLKTPDGQAAVVVGGSVPAVHDGWMWDLTVPGNDDHDFYVIPTVGKYDVNAEATPVLVHNVGECPVNGVPHGTIGEAAERQEMEKEGYTNIVPQVRFVNSQGKVFIVDYVEQNASDDWEAVEVKTRAGAQLTENQAIGYPELQNSGAVLDTTGLTTFGLMKGTMVKMNVRIALLGCPACGSTP
jgi:hypothetical protein